MTCRWKSGGARRTTALAVSALAPRCPTWSVKQSSSACCRPAGNRQRAAQLLGISTRTLLRKIRKFALEDPLRPATPASEESPNDTRVSSWARSSSSISATIPSASAVDVGCVSASRRRRSLPEVGRCRSRASLRGSGLRPCRSPAASTER